MIDEEAHRAIGELKARCMMLESRVAALAAFACAMLEGNPRCDELQTRWGKHLGPALEALSGLDQDRIDSASIIPGWVLHHLQGKGQSETG